MNYILHSDAEEEFFQAIEYYESCEKELGLDFSSEVFHSIKRIIDFPKSWSIISLGIRRCLVNRFPYGILYSIESGNVYILAVMHLKKGPDYWKHRMN